MFNATYQIFRGPSLHNRRPCARIELTGPLPPAIDAQTIQTRLRAMAVPREPWQIILDHVAAIAPDAPLMPPAEMLGRLGVVLQDDWLYAPLSYHVRPKDGEPDRVVIIETHDVEALGLTIPVALSLTQDLFAPVGQPVNPTDAVQRSTRLAQFIEQRNNYRLDADTRLLAEAAKSRGIPVHRPLANVSKAVLGQGKKRRWIMQNGTDRTNGIAVTPLASDKSISLQICMECGLPIPEQFAPTNREQLDQAIRKIGFPLVIKGQSGARSETVTTNIRRTEDIPAAIKKATAQGAMPLVQPHIPGESHRLVVIDGRLVAVARCNPAQVIGDGRHTISALIDAENKRREEECADLPWVNPLPLDQESLSMLADIGLTPDDIPAENQTIRLRNIAFTRFGGLPIDVTDAVHPEIRDMAERVTRVIGLDIAGIDLVTTDISKPLLQTGGAFIEINAYPSMRVHRIARNDRMVTDAIMDYQFPDGDDGRLPIAAVTGTNGKTTVTRMLRTILNGAGLTTASCTTGEAMIGTSLIAQGDVAGGRIAQTLLRDPAVEAGVFEMARGGLVTHGATLDRWSIGIVTNLSEDHLGLDGIETLDDMTALKRLVVELADDAAVLNADNAHCVTMADHVAAPVWWTSLDPEKTPIDAHCSDGGHAVVLERIDDREQLVWRHGRDRTVLIAADEIPATFDGALRFNIENALAAAAGALALGRTADDVRAGLSRFGADLDHNPARMNMYKVHGVTIINDYGHNADGLAQVIRFLNTLECPGRRLCVLSWPQDRKSIGFETEAPGLARAFDHLYVAGGRSDRPGPAAKPDEIVRTLLHHGADQAKLGSYQRDHMAFAAAFDAVRPGDLLFIVADDYRDAVQWIEKYDGPPQDPPTEQRKDTPTA